VMTESFVHFKQVFCRFVLFSFLSASNDLTVKQLITQFCFSVNKTFEITYILSKIKKKRTIINLLTDLSSFVILFDYT